jgi:pimeloyl-ACP methyl ester carboxylesterase
MPQLTQPLLIVHGENDRDIPLTDAHRAIDAAGSADKELGIFTPPGAEPSTSTPTTPIPHVSTSPTG